MNKKIVIFDFDGTIANTLPFIIEFILRIAPQLGYKDLTPKIIEEIRSMTYGDIIKKYHVPLYKIPYFILKGKGEMSRNITNIPLFQGIDDVIKQLKKKNYVLGILSTNSKKNIESFLNFHDLNLFNFIYSELNLFGKARSLNKIIDKYNLKKEETIYVGDEVRDIEACKKVGIDIISVTWGFNTKEILSKNNPTFIADKPEEIIDII